MPASSEGEGGINGHCEIIVHTLWKLYVKFIETIFDDLCVCLNMYKD